MKAAWGWHVARGLAAFVAGGLFSLGLVLAEMTNPVKVLNFLDVGGAWDPSLMVVLGVGVLTAGVGYRMILRRPGPLLAPHFALPKRTDVDRPLVLGAVCFGVGWGLAGYCPGPGLAALNMDNPEALWFAPALLVGLFSRRWVEQRRKAAAL